MQRSPCSQQDRVSQSSVKLQLLPAAGVLLLPPCADIFPAMPSVAVTEKLPPALVQSAVPGRQADTIQ
jgi:hypothetical protein